MTDHQSSSSPPSSPSHMSSTYHFECKQKLKVIDREKLGKFPGNEIAASLTLNFKLSQVSTLECETYKLRQGNWSKVHKATQTDLQAGKQSFCILLLPVWF